MIGILALIGQSRKFGQFLGRTALLFIIFGYSRHTTSIVATYIGSY